MPGVHPVAAAIGPSESEGWQALGVGPQRT
jgi:hypothetical protein